MNLGFWIAWFQYQKLKIFLFEYLTWRQRILPREGFSPSSRDWFEGFFLDQELNQKVLNEGLNWRRILRAGEGGWIIINDRIFTTPNKENKTLQLHPPSDFFPFFSVNSCCFSFIIMPDFWSCNHVFIPSFQREQLADTIKRCSWCFEANEVGLNAIGWL